MIEISKNDLYKAWHGDSSKQRRAKVKELLAIYHHNWLELLEVRIDERYMEQTAEKLRQRADTSLNLLRWIADEAAAIYSQPVVRSVNGTSEGLEPYESSGGLDNYLDAACRYTWLCREVALRPLLYDGRIVVDVITPDRFTVIPHPVDPTGFLAIAIELSNKGKKKYVVWTTEEWFYADAQFNPVEAPMPNPYGRIPYLVAHDRFPTMSFFNESDMDGLKDATFEAAIMFTEHRHLRHFQSFKQLVISGSADEKIGRAMADPAHGLLLKNPSASATVLDMQANLREHIETLFQAIRPVLLQYGIWADAVRGRPDTNSGYALSLKMHKQQTMWQRMRVQWRHLEQALYSLSRLVLEVDGGPALPEGELVLDYPEVGPKSDPGERVTLAEGYKRLGMSRAMIWREVFGKSEEWIAQNEVELFEEMKRDDPLAIPELSTESGNDGDPATVEVLDETEVAEAEV